MWQAWIYAIIGIWLIISGLLVSLNTSWNYNIIGILLFIHVLRKYKTRQCWLSGLLGFWLIICAILQTLMVPLNLIIVGIAVIGISFWEVYVVKHKSKQFNHHELKTSIN